MSDKIVIVLYPDPITVYDERPTPPQADPVDLAVFDSIAVGRPLTHIPPTVEAMRVSPEPVAPHPDIYLSDGTLLTLSGAWVEDEDGNYIAR